VAFSSFTLPQSPGPAKGGERHGGLRKKVEVGLRVRVTHPG
jgi:hypothetical protein